MKEVQLNQESDTDYFTAQPFDLGYEGGQPSLCFVNADLVHGSLQMLVV